LRPPFLAVPQEASAMQQARSTAKNEEGLCIIANGFITGTKIDQNVTPVKSGACI
jgi:hypothetical protein